MIEKYNPVYDTIQPVTGPSTGLYPDAETFTIDRSLKFEGEGSYFSEEKGGIAVFETLADYKMVIGTDKTLYGMLKKNKDIFPNGPYCIDSRDDGVTIHNRNFNQKPKFVFTYRGGNGELLNCSVRTKKKEVAVQAEQSSNIDPLTKTLDTTVSQTCSDPEVDLMQQYEDYKRGKKFSVDYLKNYVTNPNNSQSNREEEEKQKYISSAKTETETRKDLQSNYTVTEQDIRAFMSQAKTEFKELYDNAKATGDIMPLVKANSMSKFVVKVKKPIKMTVNPVDYSTIGNVKGTEPVNPYNQPKFNPYEYPRNYYSGIKYLESNPSIVIVGYNMNGSLVKKEDVPFESYPLVTIIQEKEVEVELDGARVMSSPLAMGIKDIQTSNNLANNIQHIIEGDATIVGNPCMVSSIIINLRNLSNRYSGDWYTTEVKHKINSSSGYTCDIKMIRKGIKVVVSQITSKADTKSIYAELHKVANDAIDKGILTEAKINQYFLEGVKKDPELEGKSLVLDLNKPDSEGNYPIHAASEDQINITREREKHRLKNQ